MLNDISVLDFDFAWTLTSGTRKPRFDPTAFIEEKRRKQRVSRTKSSPGSTNTNNSSLGNVPVYAPVYAPVFAPVYTPVYVPVFVPAIQVNVKHNEKVYTILFGLYPCSSSYWPLPIQPTSWCFYRSATV